jgi:nucleoside-diphosphate-sugar epimerase
VVAGLIHKFYLANAASSSDALTIKTGLDSMRQFINAKDIAKIIQHMISKFDAIEYTNIILADDDMLITDLIKMISRKFPNVNYEISDSEQGQSKKKCSNQLFKQTYPEYELISIETGIAETIDWFLSNVNQVRK